MRGWAALLPMAAIIGIFAVINAQALATSTPTTAFDGTYKLVSSAKLNETYTGRGGMMGHCPDRRPGPLHVVGGKVHYTTASGRRIAGMIGPQGEMDMRMSLPGTNTLEMQVSGNIDNNGTAHIRQRGNSCSYDFLWKK